MDLSKRTAYFHRLLQFFFLKFSLSIRTCCDCPNVHIHTFRKRSSFTCGCIFPVSILNILFIVERKPNKLIILLYCLLF